MNERMAVAERVLTSIQNFETPSQADLAALQRWVEPKDAYADPDELACIVINAIDAPLEFVLVCPTTGKALYIGLTQEQPKEELQIVFDCPHCGKRHTGDSAQEDAAGPRVNTPATDAGYTCGP
jgi:hypothetical protein